MLTFLVKCESVYQKVKSSLERNESGVMCWLGEFRKIDELVSHIILHRHHSDTYLLILYLGHHH